MAPARFFLYVAQRLFTKEWYWKTALLQQLLFAFATRGENASARTRSRLVLSCSELVHCMDITNPNRNVLTILQTGLEISYLVDKNRLLLQKPQDISLQDLWIQHEYNHRLLHFPADEFLNRPFKTAAMLMLSILVPYNAFPVLLRIQYTVSVRDDRNSNFLWFPNFYIAINIYVIENSTDSFHLLIVRLRNLPLRPRYRPGTTHPRGRIQDFF